MYHIPLDKRDIVGTERFSIPGIPCLYVGFSVYDIWLEMGRPAYSDFNVSALKLTEEGKKLQILNLAINPRLFSEIDAKKISLLKSALVLYPLIIATSIRSKKHAGKFRSDYIISHLIMLNIKKMGIDGVAYISKRIEVGNEDLAYPQYINFAFPAFEASKINKEYGTICEKVLITKPRNYEEFLSLELNERKKHCFYKKEFKSGQSWDRSTQVIISGKIVDYEKTKFCEFENSICGQEFFELN